MSEWIDINEKLPEIGYDKLFPFASRMILLSDGYDTYYGQFENAPGMNSGGCFLDSDGNDFEDADIKIIHWQPLPPPSKKPINGNDQHKYTKGK